MKPSTVTTEDIKRLQSERSHQSRRSIANVDCHYNTATMTGFGVRQAKRAQELHAFREMSENYFAHEAPQSFYEEALVFGFIALTAALPIFSDVSALAHFLRVINAL